MNVIQNLNELMICGIPASRSCHNLPNSDILTKTILKYPGWRQF